VEQACEQLRIGRIFNACLLRIHVDERVGDGLADLLGAD
jgi:hypothetical protein